MFVASKIVSRLQPAQSVRSMSVLSGPPQVRISAAEKLVHGVIIASGVLAIPVWVLVNIKNYKGAN